MIRKLALCALMVVSLSLPRVASAGEVLTPIDRMPRDNNKSYRTDYGERKLEAGLDVGYSLLLGTTIRAFKPAPTVTPYLDVSFGDGNSLDFQVVLGYGLMDEDDAQYYFFRSPVVAGADAEGELRFAIPTVTFRYENDLTPKLGRRGRVFFWAGMGLGAGLVSSAAELTGAGTLPSAETKHEDTLETFFAAVPALGFRFRLTEFLFVNISSRFTALVQFGRPDVLEEGDLEGFRTFDTSVGVSYEFGG